MYICLCKSLTDRDIRRGVSRGEVACMHSLRERLGATTGCGSCEAAARQCLDQALAEKRLVDRRSQEGGDRGITPAVLDLGDASAA